MSDFSRAFNSFEEAFYGMALLAGEDLEPDESSHEERQQRCLEELQLLGEVWNKDPATWKHLSALVHQCIDSFKRGEFAQGHAASKEVQKILWGVKK